LELLSHVSATATNPSCNQPRLTTDLTARVICIASGKGGTGKSVMASNIGCHFARMGQRVVVLDADMGLGNIHLLLNVQPQYNILDLLQGQTDMEGIIMDTPFGLQLISGGSGLMELADLSRHEVETLANLFVELEQIADLLLIDTAAGISPQTMMFLHAANEIIIVVTPEITAIMDAYATIKSTVQFNRSALIGLVVNQVKSKREGEAVFAHLNQICDRYLKKKLINYGLVNKDTSVNKAIAQRQPVRILFPESRFSRCISRVANRMMLVGEKYGDRLTLSTGSFFSRLQQQVWI